MRWHRLEDAFSIGPGRRSIRLRGYDYRRAGAYFITIRATHHLFGCVQNGLMILNDYGRIASECWHSIPDHFAAVSLDAFVVMPDHVHGILLLKGVPNTRAAGGRITAGSLGTIVRSFKSAVTCKINDARGTIGAKVWQRNYYEHVARQSDDLDQIRLYIASNPNRWRQNHRENPRDKK